MFIETKEGQTHAVCEEQLKKYGGKAKCCLCNKHDGCDLANSKGMFSPHEMTKAIKHAMKVSKKEQDEVLRNAELENIVAELFFWARRYAHGRHTYLPDVIRRIYKTLTEKYPSIYIPRDETIEPPKENTGGMHFRDDYLDDINL